MGEIKGKPVMLFIGTGKNQNVLKRNHNDKKIVISDDKDYTYWIDRRMISVHRVIESKTDLGFVDLDVHGNFSKEKTLEYARKVSSKVNSKYGSKPTIYESGGTGYHVEFKTSGKSADTLRNELRELCEDLNEDFDGFTTGIVKGDGVRTDTTTLKTNGNIRVPYALHEKYGGIKKPVGGDSSDDGKLPPISQRANDEDKDEKLQRYLTIREKYKHLFDKYRGQEDLSGKTLEEKRKSFWQHQFDPKEMGMRPHFWEYPVDKEKKLEKQREKERREERERWKKTRHLTDDEKLRKYWEVRNKYKALFDQYMPDKADDASVTSLPTISNISEELMALPGAFPQRDERTTFGQIDISPGVALLWNYFMYSDKGEIKYGTIATLQYTTSRAKGLTQYNKVLAFESTNPQDTLEQLRSFLMDQDLDDKMLQHVADVERREEEDAAGVIRLFPQKLSVRHDKLISKRAKEKSIGIFAVLPKSLAKQFPSLGEHDDSKPHITVLYVGKNVKKNQHELLLQTVNRVLEKWMPFTVEFDSKVSYFPATKQSDGCKVAKMKIISEQLGKLHKEFKKALIDVGIEVDDHFSGYNPHVTLEYMTPPKTKYDGQTPEGAWLIDSVEVWGCGGGKPLKLNRVLSKRAEVPYGWWLSPTGELYSVGMFGHEEFVIKHIEDLFGSSLEEIRRDVQPYDIAFREGWTRIIFEHVLEPTHGGYLAVELPALDDKHLHRVKAMPTSMSPFRGACIGIY